MNTRRTLTASILAGASASILLAGCGGSSSPADFGPSVTITIPVLATSRPTPPPPDPALVKTWPVKFCTTQPGMTQAQLTAIMGTPTGFYPSKVNPQQIQWTAYGINLTAFMNADGTARQLDDSNGTANLGCATPRR